jgi:hypothetical protein
LEPPAGRRLAERSLQFFGEVRVGSGAHADFRSARRHPATVVLEGGATIEHQSLLAKNEFSTTFRCDDRQHYKLQHIKSAIIL